MSIDAEKLTPLKILLKRVNESVTKQDFVDSFKAVNDFVKVIKAKNDKELQGLESKFDDLAKSLENGTKSEISDLREQAISLVQSHISRLDSEYRAKLETIDKKLASVKDGDDADEERVIQQVMERLPKPEPIDLSEYNEYGNQIKLLEKKIDEIPKQQGRAFGGSRHIQYAPDVKLTNIANNDVLKWNSTTRQFENSSDTGVTDHGDLTGLTDDDHSQYHNDARGDARYSQLAHTHDGRYYTEAETDTLLAGKANSLGSDDNYVTDAEKVKLSNLSGTNTGDQDLSPYFHKTNDDTDDIIVGAVNKFATAAEKTKLGHLTITQAVDLDSINTRVNALDAAVILMGTWDASSGSFPGGGSAQAGESYIVSVGGTVNGVAFVANDRILAITDNASSTTYASNWHKLDYTDQVLSVAGKTGAVTLAITDIPDITASAAELNILDGATLTTTELNYVDGVTSAIQTQLDSKLSTVTAASTYQPLDSDLTTIAGLSATTDNFIQAKGSAWTSRTVAQVKTDLAIDMLAPLGTVEISVTGATTATIGRMHVCSGTTADYTVTLPAASGNTGKFIGFRMASGLTKYVTIDGNSSETIDGATTRLMWAGESAILFCDGSNWFKVAGKTIPMSGGMHLAAAGQSINNITMTKVSLSISDGDIGGVVDTSNNRFNIRRTGQYNLIGQGWFNSIAVTIGLIDFFKNGSQLYETYGFSPSSSYNFVPKASVTVSLNSGDNIDLRVYQDSGSSASMSGSLTTLYTNMSIFEIPVW